jgi:hypothetical protein
VLKSSNSNVAVNFSAGLKDVMNDIPAESQATMGKAIAMAIVFGG